MPGCHHPRTKSEEDLRNQLRGPFFGETAIFCAPDRPVAALQPERGPPELRVDFGFLANAKWLRAKRE